MAEVRTIARDHYTEITAKILTALEAGTPPWRRPWDPAKAVGGAPRNGITGHRYRGINALLLGMSPQVLSTGDTRWVSFKQATEKGWQVRKGERSSPVIFFKNVPVSSDRSGKDIEAERTIPVVRTFPVFHASQVEGFPPYAPPSVDEAPWRTPQSATVILLRSGAVMREHGDRAFYAPGPDIIQMPPRGAFQSAESWAATMMHELGHWTGHPTRLDRNLSGRFGTEAYAMEELRAELASAFVGAELGIGSDVENHASYVASWISVLRSDKREIFRAAADAQRIADHLLSMHPLYAAQMPDSAEPVQPAATPLPRAAPEKQTALPMPAHILRTLGRAAEEPVATGVPVFPETPEHVPGYGR